MTAPTEQRCYVIAEIGINHNGDLRLARKMIEVAASSGCDAVKFQKRTVGRVYSSAELARPRVSPFGSTNGDLKFGLEFDAAQFAELMAFSASLAVDCFASVWDVPSVEFMAALSPRYLKVPSPLIRHHGLLAECRRSGLPVIMSTGGADEADVAAAMEILGPETGLMHCVSAYPCPPEESNLRQMITLRERFGVPVGYSSHEEGPHVVWAAVALGAAFIERHITLDRRMWGSDQSMSTGPTELGELVTGIRTVEHCLGSPRIRRLPIEGSALDKLQRDHDYDPGPRKSEGRDLDVERLAEALHNGWLDHMQARGYRYGTVTDPANRQHTEVRPYAELPPASHERERSVATGLLSRLAELGYRVVPASDGNPAALTELAALARLVEPLSIELHRRSLSPRRDADWAAVAGLLSRVYADGFLVAAVGK